MHNRIAVLVLATWSAASLAQGINASSRSCPSGPFSADQRPIIRSKIDLIQGSNQSDPPEISRVQNGVVSYYIGELVNSGVHTWYAYDADRWLLISVLRYDKPFLAAQPKINRRRHDQFVRFTRSAGYRHSEDVTLLRATVDQAKKLACLMNDSWHSKAPPSDDRFRNMPTDTADQQSLVISNGQQWSLQGGDPLFSDVIGPLQAP